MSAEHLFESMKVILKIRQLIQTSDMMVPLNLTPIVVNIPSL